MKSIVLFFAATSIAYATQPCGVVCNQSATHVVTLYATAVGVPYFQQTYQAVPVAVLANFTYSYGGPVSYQPQATAMPETKSKADAILAALERISSKLDGVPVAGGPIAARATGPVSQVSVNANCVSCHSPAKRSGGLDLSNLASVSSEKKLAAILSITSGAMPKGKPLSDPTIAGNLITELSGGTNPPSPSASSPTE